MKIMQWFAVVGISVFLTGCITAQPTIEKVPAADVNMLDLAELAEKAYAVTFTPVDRDVLLDAVTKVLAERGYDVEQSALDPFILIGRKDHTFTTGQLIAKGLITAIFSGATNAAPDKGIEYWFSIVATDVVVKGEPRMKLSSTVMYQVGRSDGSVKRRSMAAFKQEILDEIVEKAGAQKG